MNLLRRTLEILGFGVTTPKGKKVRSSRRLRTFRQARARHLLFEQVKDRRVLATVSAAAMSSTVMEGSPAAVYFNVSPPSMMPITVSYQTVAGTATANSDYQSVTGSTTIYPGQMFASVGVNTLPDNVVEPPETFSVTITSVTGATVGNLSASAEWSFTTSLELSTTSPWDRNHFSQAIPNVKWGGVRLIQTVQFVRQFIHDEDGASHSTPLGKPLSECDGTVGEGLVTDEQLLSLSGNLNGVLFYSTNTSTIIFKTIQQ